MKNTQILLLVLTFQIFIFVRNVNVSPIPHIGDIPKFGPFPDISAQRFVVVQSNLDHVTLIGASAIVHGAIDNIHLQVARGQAQMAIDEAVTLDVAPSRAIVMVRQFDASHIGAIARGDIDAGITLEDLIVFNYEMSP